MTNLRTQQTGGDAHTRSLRLIRLLAVFTTLAFAIAGSATPGEEAQAGGEQDGEAQEESTLERYLRMAREGSPAIRPQAARRLRLLGAPAAARLLTEIGPEGGGLAGLGRELVTELGSFPEPEFRPHLWRALSQPDFPWRPAAAQALASRATPEEGERFAVHLDDPLPEVRVGALEGISKLSRKDEVARVRAALGDESGRVRRRAAALLADWGEAQALWWLYEELLRDDQYFAVPSGRAARFEALKLLRARLGADSGFDASRGPQDNAQPLSLLARELRAQGAGERPELPPVARASARIADELLGLELRSCRRGELFLRWTAGDELLVGLGDPARVALPEGTSARLLVEVLAALEPLEDERFFGEPGCDLERYHLKAEGAERSKSWLISKGPQAVPGLRPEALDRVATLLGSSIPPLEDAEDVRLRDLSRRLAQGLTAVGGALSGD